MRTCTEQEQEKQTKKNYSTSGAFNKSNYLFRTKCNFRNFFLAHLMIRFIKKIKERERKSNVTCVQGETEIYLILH